ncbi:hypothetical protein LCGC14_1850900 [marine sediment metagenome]|uniref:Uncharacterized protein n=1 Tax=marine sediment metagenome TaxID=412755 RepID=A0A0F9IQ04_9ZZZZ
MKIKRKVSLSLKHIDIDSKIKIFLEDLENDIKQVFEDRKKNIGFNKWIYIKSEVGF